MTDIAANSEAQLIDAVRAARDWKTPLNIVGARTKRNFGRATASWGTVLDVSGMTGVIAYEPEELIVTMAPGTPVTEIAALLASKRQRLGFDPADFGPLLGAPANAATIGGVVSADASGSARVRYGAARDQLLGFRGVNGLGEAFQAGGKVVKNVTGFDLPKLVCGAFGTLCVLTELTFRVFPKPGHATTLAVVDMDAEEGLALLRRVWSSALEPTGLAYVPGEVAVAQLGEAGKGAALLRIDGAPAPLEEKSAMLAALIGTHQTRPIENGDGIFQAIGSGAPFENNDLDVWRVALPPSQTAFVSQAIAAPLWYADWAGAMLWLGLAPGDDFMVERLESVARNAGGHATLLRAPEETRGRIGVFAPLEPAHAALTRAVKAAFDPLGLFNPGRMYEGI